MIYPDTPLHKWLAKHPGLGHAMPVCTCPDAHLRPYRTHRSAGIECTACGTSVWTAATKEGNAINLSLVPLDTLH
jgi:hypothetical protein